MLLSPTSSSAPVKNNLIWLASFPKSGNTWLRSFLSALLYDGKVDINNLRVGSTYSSKVVVEEFLDLCADDLLPKEIEVYRKIAYQYYSDISDKELFVKIHDAFTNSEIDNEPLIPIECSRLVIYIVRNPLDVALSFANHNGVDYQEAIDKTINNTEASLGKNHKSTDELYQFMGDWSMHVNSWLNQNIIPVHLVRYEDMKSNSFETFKGITKAVGLKVTDDQILRAIEATEFDKLREQEKQKGFHIKAIPSSTFFHKGETGRWKSELKQQQITQIYSAHSVMMKKLGYSNTEKFIIQS